MLRLVALACFVISVSADGDNDYSAYSSNDYYPDWHGGVWNFGGDGADFSGISVGGGIGVMVDM